MTEEIKRPFFSGQIAEWTVKDLLVALRQVTNAHMARKGSWTIFEQMCHTHSEVSELYEAVRENHPPFSILGEIFDIVFSAIANGHVLAYTDQQLIAGLEMTLHKIRVREELIHV